MSSSTRPFFKSKAATWNSDDGVSHSWGCKQFYPSINNPTFSYNLHIPLANTTAPETICLTSLGAVTPPGHITSLGTVTVVPHTVVAATSSVSQSSVCARTGTLNPDSKGSVHAEISTLNPVYMLEQVH